MTTTKPFHIGDILSITTGALVSLDHIGGVYRILNWMTGDDLMTHQLPRASRECEDNLRAQHPDLAAVEFPRDGSVPHTAAGVYGWLAEQVAKHGETREVAPLPAGEHASSDPIAELRMLRPDAGIIAVEVER